MSDTFDEDKVSKAHKDIIKIFNKHKLNVGEIVLLYGNLGYTLGASIGGYEGKGPSMEELQKAYYEKPSLAVAMMLNGANVTTWYEDIQKQTIEKDKEEK